MKIAEVTATFPPEHTGIGNVCYNNSLQLAKLGNDVTVFTTRPNSYSENEHLFDNVVYLKPLIRFGNAPILPKLVKIANYDLIHIHLPFFFGSEIMLFTTKFRGIPYVVTYHHDAILKPPFNIASFFNKFTLYKLLGHARKVFTTSLDYAYNCSIRKFLYGAKNLQELPIGVDTVRFHPDLDGSKIREELGIDADNTVILFVGGLDSPHYFKGVQFLLPAFAKLGKKSCSLIVVGDGDLKPYFIQLARRLKIDDRTFFVGNVSNEAIPFYYACSDFLVLPSYAMNEAFGKVLIEAMACGKAVIASNLPGVRSVVSSGKNGLLTKPADIGDLCVKMKLLVENPILRKKFGYNGRQKVELNYDWEQIGLRLHNCLQEVLET